MRILLTSEALELLKLLPDPTATVALKSNASIERPEPPAIKKQAEPEPRPNLRRDDPEEYYRRRREKFGARY